MFSGLSYTEGYCASLDNFSMIYREVYSPIIIGTYSRPNHIGGVRGRISCLESRSRVGVQCGGSRLRGSTCDSGTLRSLNALIPQTITGLHTHARNDCRRDSMGFHVVLGGQKECSLGNAAYFQVPGIQ